jgi:hypothetical protein
MFNSCAIFFKYFCLFFIQKSFSNFLSSTQRILKYSSSKDEEKLSEAESDESAFQAVPFMRRMRNRRLVTFKLRFFEPQLRDRESKCMNIEAAPLCFPILKAFRKHFSRRASCSRRFVSKNNLPFANRKSFLQLKQRKHHKIE